MRTTFATLVASLAVLLALFVLVSEDQTIPSGGSGGSTFHGDRFSDLGQRLLPILLRRQSNNSNATVVRAQQLLKDDGFYLGPLDGTMNQQTREALRSFQQAKRIKVTGEIDRDTARELGLREDNSLS